MYADILRDNIYLQQYATTDDNGGGQTGTWPIVIRLKCRVRQLSSDVVLRLYQREGHEEVYRVDTSDKIPRTSSETSLHRLMRKPSETRFRFLWQGDRTMTPIGMQRPLAGTSDHLRDLLWFDCMETPEGVGYQDLA